MEFGELLGKVIDNRQTLYVRYGVISAVTVSPNRVSVKVSGASTAVTGIRYLASYSPTVNDVVVCLLNDNDLIVLGKLA